MIVGLSGAIGSGKSHTQMKLALHYAQQREKQLVFNYRVNRKAMLHFARRNKYDWVEHILLNGGVSEICSPRSLQALLLPGSVVSLDEAGVFLNSRAFKDTPKELLADLAQSRKGNKETRGGVDLIWASQFLEQVDKQVRLLTQYWVHCDSLESFNKKEKRPQLFWKSIYWFKATDYHDWYRDPAARCSVLKTKFRYAFKHESGLLNQNDRLIFKIFNSTDRLDGESYDRISTADVCPIRDGEKMVEYYRAQPRKYLLSSPVRPPSHNLQVREWDGHSNLSLAS